MQVPGGASLQNRTPRETCVTVVLPGDKDTVITSVSMGSGGLVTPDPQAAPETENAPEGNVSLSAGPCADEPPCAEGLNAQGQCGIEATMRASIDDPVKPGVYRATAAFKFATLCVDRSGPCAALGDSHSPSPDKPVRAVWNATTEVCATVDANGDRYLASRCG
ncbi:hypothetical protein Acor_13630 [Acrocarpospora corrugata]|uniref:Uncharacterized protein n=1 Tax=Acrocarpospora corrugata TaxID=35763 RepID=A0A5M3VTS4_9ACTN|nr:hypothetical protein Acor_13630 [Acrocarpospora corrugata]